VAHPQDLVGRTNIIIIDTETTGLAPTAYDPEKKKKRMIHARHSDAWEQCRIVEIAWLHCDPSFNILNERSFIIRPNGFIVPEASTRVHGITTEQALAEGVPLAEALAALKQDLQSTQTIVAHNMKFDQNVILSEILRANDALLAALWSSCKPHCTMLAAARPGQKWPKLAELYFRTFNREPNVQLHRALDDVKVCAELYFHNARSH